MARKNSPKNPDRPAKADPSDWKSGNEGTGGRMPANVPERAATRPQQGARPQGESALARDPYPPVNPERPVVAGMPDAPVRRGGPEEEEE